MCMPGGGWAHRQRPTGGLKQGQAGGRNAPGSRDTAGREDAKPPSLEQQAGISRASHTHKHHRQRDPHQRHQPKGHRVAGGPRRARRQRAGGGAGGAAPVPHQRRHRHGQQHVHAVVSFLNRFLEANSVFRFEVWGRRSKVSRQPCQQMSRRCGALMLSSPSACRGRPPSRAVLPPSPAPRTSWDVRLMGTQRYSAPAAHRPSHAHPSNLAPCLPFLHLDAQLHHRKPGHRRGASPPRWQRVVRLRGGREGAATFASSPPGLHWQSRHGYGARATAQRCAQGVPAPSASSSRVGFVAATHSRLQGQGHRRVHHAVAADHEIVAA